ncbi:hypothetical protein CR513_10102, partial [Mucuna pruriens]
MEMSNLTSKLKSLKLKLGEDLFVHLVLISLLAYFGQFKVNYNTQKDKWSLNELISHCRGCKKMTKSTYFASISQNKKRKNIKGKPKKDEEFTEYFCKKSRHMKKHCPKYVAWHVKKGKFLALVCSEVNLTFVPKDTWWVHCGATTHISVTMQGFLWSRLPSDYERFIFVNDGNKLKTKFILDLFETFGVPSLRWNLISISSLENFGLSCSFGNNKVSLYYNLNVISYGSLIDNLYIFYIVSSYKKIPQTNSQASCNGQQYFITFIDDYSRYSYLYLIREKPQSLNVFKSFKAEVELQLTKKIKVVKSNCGDKYYGKSLRREVLKIIFYILNRVISIKHLHIWGCPAEAQPYRLHERKLDSRTVSNSFVGYNEHSWGYKFYNPLSRYIFETRNARFLEEIEFEKEENIMNVVVEKEFVNDIVSLRISIRERRHAILDDCIVFLQEHEDVIILTKDDPINFFQAMHSSNSKKRIDAMKDEMKFVQDNDVWDLIELPKGVKPTGCKWKSKTKDPNDNIEKYKTSLVAKSFTKKEDIDYIETFYSIS